MLGHRFATTTGYKQKLCQSLGEERKFLGRNMLGDGSLRWRGTPVSKTDRGTTDLKASTVLVKGFRPLMLPDEMEIAAKKF